MLLNNAVPKCLPNLEVDSHYFLMTNMAMFEASFCPITIVTMNVCVRLVATVDSINQSIKIEVATPYAPPL